VGTTSLEVPASQECAASDTGVRAFTAVVGGGECAAASSSSSSCARVERPRFRELRRGGIMLD